MLSPSTLPDLELVRRVAVFEEIAGLGSWELDLRSGRALWSPGLYRLLDYVPDAQAPLSEAYLARVHPDDLERVLAVIEAHMLSDAPHDYRYRLLLPDGRVRTVRDRGRRFFDEAGRAERVLAVVQDVSREARLEAELATAANALDLALEGLVVLNADGRVLQVNRAFVAITGFDPRRSTQAGFAIDDLLEAHDREDHFRTIQDQARRHGRWAGQLALRHRDGTQVPVWCTVVWQRADAATPESRYVVLLTDISRLEETSRRVAWAATHDDLTGLLTRTPFLQATADALDEAARYDRTPTVLFLDLDGFKAINDREGHAAGDRVLRAVADALRGLLREDDTVSRWGGDEFAVLLRSVGVAGAMRVAEKMVLACAGVADGARASVGVARYPDHGATAELLLQAADAAMYRAKAAGGGCARLALRPA
jgi:diguanylate cyclase (GGDEF)-like protein/PAS domain S-box-containing protein